MLVDKNAVSGNIFASSAFKVHVHQVTQVLDWVISQLYRSKQV